MGHIKSYDEFLADLPAALDLYDTRTVEGSRYLGPKDACDQIRKDLKLATVSGVLPAGVKLSIRRNDHNSIYVEIVTWPGQILTTEYELYYRDQIVTPDSSKSWDRYRDRPFGTRCWNDRCVDALNDAMRFIERVSNRHNFDKSDIQTDYFHVGYYLHVEAHSLVSQAEAGIRLEMDPKLGLEILAAMNAAKRLGPKVTKSVCGRHGVEECGEWARQRLIKLDGIAKGRPMAYDKRARGWRVVDSATEVEA